MKPDRRHRLVEIMTALPHDPAFMVSLVNEFRDELTAHARWQVRRLETWAHPDEIDTLVMLFAAELHECAAAWKADGGALPWVWASARLRQVTIEVVRPARMLDYPLPEGYDPPDDSIPVWNTHDGVVDWTVELAKLGEVDERVARFVDAVDRHSDRDVRMLLEFVDRRCSREPAAGSSVAEMFAIEEATVRKAIQRVRDTIRDAGLDRELPSLFNDRDRCQVANAGSNALESTMLEPVGTVVHVLAAA